MVAAARGIARVPRQIALATGEFKAIDTSGNCSANVTTAVVLCNGCARGDEINERTGREIVMKSIQLQYNAVSTATTGIVNHVRVMVVYDRQANGAALTAAQVLSNTGGADGTLCPRNLENRRRFWILYDRSVVVGPQGVTTTALGALPLVHRQWYRRITLPVTFNNGDAGSVADITTGSLYLVVVGNQADGNTDADVYYHVRVRYQDK